MPRSPGSGWLGPPRPPETQIAAWPSGLSHLCGTLVRGHQKPLTPQESLSSVVLPIRHLPQLPLGGCKPAGGGAWIQTGCLAPTPRVHPLLHHPTSQRPPALNTQLEDGPVFPVSPGGSLQLRPSCCGLNPEVQAGGTWREV